MSGPNVFLPSDLVTPPSAADFEDSSLRQQDGVQSIRIKAAPFLEKSIVRDLSRRNYLVAPGGKCYFIAGKPVSGE